MLLTKSNFIAGLQCEKRLWLEKFDREKQKRTEAETFRMQEGVRVGELARSLYPNGVLIKQPAWEQQQAVEATQRHLSDGANVLFESAFTSGEYAVRIDILRKKNSINVTKTKNTHPSLFDKMPEEWEIVEVKSSLWGESKNPKDDQILDAAYQYFVATKAGLNVTAVFLMLLNPDYVYTGGDYDLNLLFKETDITDIVKEKADEIEKNAGRFLSVLALSEAPPIEIGLQCEKPYKCPFFDYCHAEELDIDDILNLPRLTTSLLEKIKIAGFNKISEISDDFKLSETQRRVVDVHKSNEPFLTHTFADELRKLQYPIHFLDFETIQTALPRFPNTKPQEVIPFQWSNHIMNEDGSIYHEEFLFTKFDDPRTEFCETLYQSIKNAKTIVVYSGYEERVLNTLHKWNPELVEPILSHFKKTQFDMYKLILEQIYFKEFKGSFSLKNVLPALVSDCSYNDLEIQDGDTAWVKYFEMINPDTPPNESQKIRQNLLEYCKLDTWAMVRLYQKLLEIHDNKIATH